MADMRERDPVAARPPGRASPAPETDKSAFGFDRRGDDEGIGDLLRRLTDQGTHLAEKQVELVRAELRSSVNDMKQAAGAMAGAAVLGLAGLGVTLMGIAFLLGEAMSLWLATLIVGIATLVGAYAMYSAGTSKLNSNSMSAERTRRTLERAPDAISGDTEDRTNG